MFDDPKFIAAMVALVVNIGALVKAYSDIMRIKADRLSTKENRDSDSQNLHDQVQKLTWENSRLREDMQFMKSGFDDHTAQLNIFNTELAKVSTKLDNALDILRELKELKK